MKTEKFGVGFVGDREVPAALAAVIAFDLSRHTLREMIRTHFDDDSCIASAALAVSILRDMGVKVEAVAAHVISSNAAYVEWANRSGRIIPLTEEEQEVINKVFSNLQFETGKAVIKESSYPSLDALAQLMTKKPSFKLNIDGHTDNVGSAAMNKTLSQKRADAAKTYLTNKGVDASRIKSKGYGKDKPVGSNATPEGRAKNRRVEFLLFE